MLLSLAATALSVTLNFADYRLTNSVGLFSDRAESLVNVVTALTALFALRDVGGGFQMVAGEIGGLELERLPAPSESAVFKVTVCPAGKLAAECWPC